jgi:hypothetical protein
VKRLCLDMLARLQWIEKNGDRSEARRSTGDTVNCTDVLCTVQHAVMTREKSVDVMYDVRVRDIFKTKSDDR